MLRNIIVVFYPVIQGDASSRMEAGLSAAQPYGCLKHEVFFDWA
jgi:hypothetical protein